MSEDNVVNFPKKNLNLVPKNEKFIGQFYRVGDRDLTEHPTQTEAEFLATERMANFCAKIQTMIFDEIEENIACGLNRCLCLSWLIHCLSGYTGYDEYKG